VGIKQSVCEKINDKLGLGTVIPTTSDVILSEDLIDEISFRNSGVDILYYVANENVMIDSIDTGANLISGSPAACYFERSAGEHVFYSVLVAR